MSAIKKQKVIALLKSIMGDLFTSDEIWSQFQSMTKKDQSLILTRV